VSLAVGEDVGYAAVVPEDEAVAEYEDTNEAPGPNEEAAVTVGDDGTVV
jgi:hypothetical protein